MTALSPRTAHGAHAGPSYWADVRSLAVAQKTAARGAPAYSRYVNRRLGRLLAAASLRAGLRPNAVTLISGAFTLAGIALLLLYPPSVPLGLAISLCLVVGYAFDSADGQVARMQGGGSPAGEWLDHMVDAAKTSMLPLALAVGLYRFEAVDRIWLLVPLGAAVVSAVLFFGMILTEQLRRRTGTVPVAGQRSWIRSVLSLPMDYGVLCLTFALYGVMPAFTAVYTLIFALTLAFLLMACTKWFRELSAAAPASHARPNTRPATAMGSGGSR